MHLPNFFFERYKSKDIDELRYDFEGIYYEEDQCINSEIAKKC